MKLPKVGIALLNYNLPNETDTVYDALVKNLDNTNYEICVVDNASDKAPPSKYTTIKSIVNSRTMGAILLAAHYFNRNPDVKYVIDDIEYYWEKGNIYEFDNMRLHGVINRSNQHRVHLVINLYNLTDEELHN